MKNRLNALYATINPLILEFKQKYGQQAEAQLTAH